MVTTKHALSLLEKKVSNMLVSNTLENAGLVMKWENTVKNQTPNVTCHVRKTKEECAEQDGETVSSDWTELLSISQCNSTTNKDLTSLFTCNTT